MTEEIVVGSEVKFVENGAYAADRGTVVRIWTDNQQRKLIEYKSARSGHVRTRLFDLAIPTTKKAVASPKKNRRT